MWQTAQSLRILGPESAARRALRSPALRRPPSAGVARFTGLRKLELDPASRFAVSPQFISALAPLTLLTDLRTHYAVTFIDGVTDLAEFAVLTALRRLSISFGLNPRYSTSNPLLVSRATCKGDPKASHHHTSRCHVRPVLRPSLTRSCPTTCYLRGGDTSQKISWHLRARATCILDIACVS